MGGVTRCLCIPVEVQGRDLKGGVSSGGTLWSGGAGTGLLPSLPMDSRAAALERRCCLSTWTLPPLSHFSIPHLSE